MLCLTILLSAIGCSSDKTQTEESTFGEQSTSAILPDAPSENEPSKGISLREREERRMNAPEPPKNETREETLPKAPDGATLSYAGNCVLVSGQFKMLFTKENGNYAIRVSDGKEMYIAATPVNVTVNGAAI